MIQKDAMSNNWIQMDHLDIFDVSFRFTKRRTVQQVACATRMLHLWLNRIIHLNPIVDCYACLKEGGPKIPPNLTGHVVLYGTCVFDE